MGNHIFNEAVEILPLHKLRSLTLSEWKSPNDDSSRKRFDEKSRKRFGGSRDPPYNWVSIRHNIEDLDQQEDKLF